MSSNTWIPTWVISIAVQNMIPHKVEIEMVKQVYMPDQQFSQAYHESNETIDGKGSVDVYFELTVHSKGMYV